MSSTRSLHLRKDARRMRKCGRESGSALLIVFLLAATLAIYLYMEMPVVVFEAKRAKEQLLIDRGNEYAHAAKLYYRKFRTYPPSIDAFENTNRIRFLRHRFKDPMTGEENWRLLHAGPGGQLLDSKVNPIGLNANGQSSGAATSGFGSSGTNGASAGATAAGQSGSSSAATTGPASGTETVAGLPQRAPEMPVSSSATNAMANADPTQSLLTPGSSAPVTGATSASMSGNSADNNPNSQTLIPLTPQTQAANTSNPSNPMQGVQQLVTNPNPLNAPSNLNNAASPMGRSGPMIGVTTPGASNGTGSSMGVLQSGGIAGVASTAKGSSIKAVNDQTDYSLWEFYYDPSKDVAGVGQSGINPMNGATQTQGNGVTIPAGSTPTTVPLAGSTGSQGTAAPPQPPQQP